MYRLGESEPEAGQRLYERADALAAGRACLHGLLAGHGGSVFFVADAGQGKSSVLTALRYEAATLGIPPERTLVARGHPLEVDLPYSLFDQVLDLDLAGHAGPDTSTAVVQRMAVRARARSALRSLCQAGPVAVLADDIHWSDPDSLALLVYLCRRLRDIPVALLGAARPWPEDGAATIGSLVAEGVASRTLLSPLSRAASAAVLAERTGRSPDLDEAARAFEMSGGNPQLLVEAARVLAAEGRLPDVSSRPPAFERSLLLLNQVVGLPPVATAVVRACAVAGARFRISCAEAVSGLPADDFAAAFDDLVASGVLHSEGKGQWAFAHEMVSGAVLDDIPPATRRLMHRRAVEHHLERGDEDAAVAHLLAGDLSDDRRAVGLLRSAGLRAISEGAIETGLGHLSRAVEAAAASPDPALLADQADALLLTGRTEQAVTALESALTGPLDPEMERHLETRLARALIYAGRMEEALPLFSNLIEHAGNDASHLASLLVERSRLLWSTAGIDAALESLRLPDGLADHPALEPVRLMARGERFQGGDISEVDDILAEGRTAPDWSPEAGGDLGAATNLILEYTSTLGALQLYEESEPRLTAAIERFAAAGALLPTVALRIVRSGQLLHQGRLIEAIVDTEDIEEQLDMGPVLGPQILQMRALAQSWLGLADEAAATRAAAGYGRPGTPWFAGIGLGTSAALDRFWAGDMAAAAAEFDRIENLANGHGLRNPLIMRWQSGAIEAWLAVGRLDDVHRLSEQIARYVGQLPTDWPALVVYGARAGIAAAHGDEDETERCYRRSLAAAAPAPLERLMVALRFGRWLRRSRRSTEARPVLAELVAQAGELGLKPLAAEAHRELVAAGGRRRRGGAPSILTPQQARVVALAATGATNREIADVLYLSPRTVETHLTLALGKLGIRTKAELRRRRNELQLGDPEFATP